MAEPLLALLGHVVDALAEALEMVGLPVGPVLASEVRS